MCTFQTTVDSDAQGPVENHFIIGQDATGHWLALETHRLGGGLFRSLRSAIQFVEFETGHRANSYELSSKPLSLTF